MSTVGIGSGGISTTSVADTVVIRMVVGMISWTSDGINGEFAGNSDAKEVEVVDALRCCSRSCCVTAGISGCTMS